MTFTGGRSIDLLIIWVEAVAAGNEWGKSLLGACDALSQQRAAYRFTIFLCSKGISADRGYGNARLTHGSLSVLPKVES